MDDQTLRSHLVNLVKMQGAHVSIDDALKELRSENRNRRPAKNVHSIWENFQHMIIAQKDLLNYVTDENWESPKWPEEYWTEEEEEEEIDDERWETSISTFNNDLEKIIELINNKEVDLLKVIPNTKNHTPLREIFLIADHNSYHTGQIIFTRKVLGDWE
jgi:uncharacterized damage-inducible protein DinB